MAWSSVKDKDKATFITVKSNRSTTQQAVAQDSNDKPNKLSCRTATRSQTRPVCNKGITQFLPVGVIFRPYGRKISATVGYFPSL